MTSRPKLILIVGLGHSGTTILDATLGCSPQVVGVGEALRTLSPSAPATGPNWHRLREGLLDEIACSCGRSAQTCPVWSEVGARFSSAGPVALQDGFSQLYNAALASKPSASCVLESTPGALEHLDALQSYDIRIIKLTRDMRSWAASRHQRRGTAVWLGEFIWVRHTRQIEKRLAGLSIPQFQLGYEEFALRPEQTLTHLCDWLEIEYVPEMLTPFGFTGSHIISGNRSVQERSLTRRLQYDGNWMARDSRALGASLVYSIFAHRNNRLVYSNKIIGHKK